LWAKLIDLTVVDPHRAMQTRNLLIRAVDPVFGFPLGPLGKAAFPLQYARLVQEWVGSIGLAPVKFGTHSLRRTKAVLIYRRTGNLRAVQLLLGHSKIESTVQYLGIEVDDAIEIAEKIDI